MSDPAPIPPQEPPQSLHRGWYSRGYLPHFDHPGLLQFITYHLADSLPGAMLRRIEQELSLVPPEKQKIERLKRLERLLDAGHGSCILRHDEAARCVVETWRRFAGIRYDLIAWVIMPNHIHLLIRVYEGQRIDRIIQSWKSYTGRRIAGLKRSQSADAGSATWMRDYWDRYIRNAAHFRNTVRYIHNNPVRARLARVPQDWPWSSARDFPEGAPQE